jgi:hypothetical protein
MEMLPVDIEKKKKKNERGRKGSEDARKVDNLVGQALHFV